MKTAKFNVKGMHCSSCEMLIQDSLEDAEGIVSAKVSNAEGIAEVSFDDSKIDVEEIRSIISKEGYEVSE